MVIVFGVREYVGKEAFGGREVRCKVIFNKSQDIKSSGVTLGNFVTNESPNSYSVNEK